MSPTTNSEPLPEPIFSGLPHHSNYLSNSRITLYAAKLVSIVIDNSSRLKSSTTFKVRLTLPLASVSCIKSKLHVIFGPIGHNNGTLTRAGRRYLRLFLEFRRIDV